MAMFFEARVPTEASIVILVVGNEHGQTTFGLTDTEARALGHLLVEKGIAAEQNKNLRAERAYERQITERDAATRETESAQ